MRPLGRDFHTHIRNATFPSPFDVGSHNPPHWGTTSLLAHHPVSGSYVGSHSELKRTIYASCGLELLQMVLELDIGRSVNEDAGPQRGEL